MHNTQLPRHSQHSPFTRRIRQLRRRAPHQRHHARRVNDTRSLFGMALEGEHAVLAAEPDAFDVYGLGEIPDLLGGVGCGGVVGVPGWVGGWG